MESKALQCIETTESIIMREKRFLSEVEREREKEMGKREESEENRKRRGRERVIASFDNIYCVSDFQGTYTTYGVYGG